MKTLLTAFLALALSATLTQAQLFTFSGASGAASDNPDENAAVSGTVDVNVGASTVKITINNDGAGFISGFGFLNSPSDSDRPNGDELTWLPSVHNLAPRAWTDTATSSFWPADQPYYGSEANPPPAGNGIQFGESGAEFTFTAIGGDLQALVDQWALPDPDPVWSSSDPTADLLFRVQDTSGPAGSDKIAINIEMPTNPIPEPSTYGLIGAAALGLMILVRRMKRS